LPNLVVAVFGEKKAGFSRLRMNITCLQAGYSSLVFGITVKSKEVCCAATSAAMTRVAGMVSPCRRAELEERDILLYKLSCRVKPDRVIAMKRVIRNSAPQDNHSYCRLFKELGLEMTGYGPSLFGNRRMRTRMSGGVEAGGEKTPAI
jgi:hypothetical protein